MQRTLFCLALLGATAQFGGCRGTMAKTKVAVMPEDSRVTREDALTVISMAVCKRTEDCEGFGASKKYASHDDCLASEHTTGSVVWREDKCGEPHAPIAGKVKECKERAATWQCSNNLLDFGGLVTECGPGNVCK